ncbi:MAG: Gfo/Idh/MocA family oxidoreductase [Tepidisphaeraceae bacterium]|jgi:predicted dehydrogenase
MLNFGILGTGNIARQFAFGVTQSSRCRLSAVASRSAESAAAFAASYNIPIALAGYDALLTRQDIDAVYVSLPNTMHHEWTIKALRAGKHVLCEKPLGANAAEAAEMFAAAHQTGRALVEAFMYRAHPLTHAVVAAVRSGIIGQVKLIRSSFCYCSRKIDGNIRFAPELAGGSLMDIGCYCISFSHLIAGQIPRSCHATGHLHESGVDDVAAGTLRFPSGIVAGFTCGMTVHADNSAYVCGDDGYIEIPVPWKPPARDAVFHVCRSIPPKQDVPTAASPPAAPPRETRSVWAGKDLYAVEADAFAAVVLDGAPPFMPEDHTMATMRTLDELRLQLGMRI